MMTKYGTHNVITDQYIFNFFIICFGRWSLEMFSESKLGHKLSIKKSINTFLLTYET